jgi:hypothetical protein
VTKSPRKYRSNHAATRPLTATEKLAEMACERIAHHEGKTLAARFWLHGEWRRRFADQARHAAALTKIYDDEAVLEAFRDAPTVRSLGAPFLHEHLRVRQAQMEAEAKRARESSPVEADDAGARPRTGPATGRSLRAKLSRVASCRGRGGVL